MLTQDGTYRIYALSTTSALPSYSQHSLGAEAQEAGVLDARIYEEGMVVLLGSLAFVEVKNWQQATDDGSVGGKVTTLAAAGLTEPPSCWCVIPPELSYTRGVEVLIGTGQTILRLDEIDVQDQVRFPELGTSALTDAASRTAPHARPVPIHHSFTKRPLPVDPFAPSRREPATMGRLVRLYALAIRL